MKKAVGIAVVVAIAVGVAAWTLLDNPETPMETTAPTVPAVATKPDSAPRSAAVAPSVTSPAASPAVAPARSPAPPPAPSLFNDFLAAKNYRALYERLKDSAEGQTAEGQLVLYEILRNCASISSGSRPLFRPPVPRREDFMASLAPGDPNRERRIAAFDDFTTDRCKGFDGISITQAELSQLLGQAAAGGDPRARALLIEQEMLQARRNAGRGDTVTLSDAQVQALQGLAASRDPEAIRVAGRVLANAWGDYALRLGPEQAPVEQRAFLNAWLVLSCEYGAPCGADTPRMLQACAMQGHCNAQSFPDFLAYYASTPHDSQMLMQYRGIIRQAIETGDWSQLQVVRGLPSPPGRTFFWPGPR